MALVLMSLMAVSGEGRPLQSLDPFFASLAYRPLLYPDLLNGQKAFVDQIYKKGSKAILVKLAIKTKTPNTMDKLLHHKKGFYFSSLTNANVPYSFFFYGVSESEAKSYLKKIAAKNFVKTELLQLLFGARAWAEAPKCESALKDVLVSFGAELNQKTIQDIAWTCSSAAGAGAKNKAEESIETLNPVNIANMDLSNFWDESVKTYEMLKELVPQLEPMMNELSGLLENFHPSLKLNLICSAIGSQTVEAITPGGVFRKLVFLKSKIAGLKKLMDMLKGMSKLYEKFPKSKTLDEATRRVGACAI